MCCARQVFQWAASSIPRCDCKYSWEGDSAAVPPPSPPPIAFPEVKRQTSLKISAGSATRTCFRRGSAGLPARLCPDLWRCAAQGRNRDIHQITSWEDGMHFVRAGALTRGGFGTVTAPGRADCFSFSMKDGGGGKKLSHLGGCAENCALSSAVEALATSWEIPAASPCCSSLSEEEGWLSDHGQVPLGRWFGTKEGAKAGC